MTRSILLIDDDPAVLFLHSRHFQAHGWEVYRAIGGEDGLRLYATHGPDVVLLDLNMPEMSGFEVLERFAELGAVVIVLTGHGEAENAVRAIKLGAENFVTKPAKLAHLDAIVEKACEKAELRRANRALSDRLATAAPAAGVGRSARMQELGRQIDRFASADDATILLLGESGTGKGWVASQIHSRSARRNKPFVEVNCAGLSAAFLDSELFGHEKGAFTDAKNMKRGLFEVASGGTLFLDEIGDLALELQPKLLKVLENRSFRRLGGTSEIRSDVRLIAATNRDLGAEVGTGRFRGDLYYRLNVLPLEIPPLRDRSTEDVLDLIAFLMADLATAAGISPPRISDAALGLLVRCDWPGNVRQMRNALEHAMVMARGGDEVGPEHLPVDVQAEEISPTPARNRFSGLTLREVERRHIQHTLVEQGGNRTRSAQALGISRTTLHNKLRDYGLEQAEPPVLEVASGA